MALFTFEDESDRIDAQGSDFDFGPNVFQNRDWFTLFEPVGMEGRNRRDDTIKVESLLGNAGYFDLDRTDGPTGYWGSRADQGLREFQTDHGLDVDGLILPKGPTLKALHGKVGGLLQGFPAPTPDEIDDHHQRLGLDKPGLIRFGRPALKLPPAPELDFESARINSRLTDHLLGLGNDGDFPSFAQRHIEQDGAPAIAQYHDLLARLGQRDRGRAHRLAWSILDRLPEDLAATFAGGAIPSIGPLAIRQQDAPEEIWPAGEGTLLYDLRAWAGRLPPTPDDEADPPSARPDDAGEIGEGETENAGESQGEVKTKDADPVDPEAAVMLDVPLGSRGGRTSFGLLGEPIEEEIPWYQTPPYYRDPDVRLVFRNGRMVWVRSRYPDGRTDGGAGPLQFLASAAESDQPTAPEGQAPQPGQSSGQTPGAGGEPKPEAEGAKPERPPTRQLLGVDPDHLMPPVGGAGAINDPNIPTPMSEPTTEEALRKTAEKGRALGLEFAADLLEHYLDKSGKPLQVGADQARQYPGTLEASKDADANLEQALIDPKHVLGKQIAEFVASDEPSRTVKIEGVRNGLGSDPTSKDYWAVGTVNVSVEGEVTLTRTSDGNINISATLTKHMNDRYDFNKNGDGLANWIKDKVPLVPTQFGGKAMTREEIDRFEKSGGAAPFDIRSAPWTEPFHLRIKVEDLFKESGRGEGLPMVP
ncbi:MAG: hypothetical protein HZC25_14000 [Rhodospirillales bacterium]|nr:hypothetical protein [Rhodospirillales bacterium]